MPTPTRNSIVAAATIRPSFKQWRAQHGDEVPRSKSHTSPPTQLLTPPPPPRPRTSRSVPLLTEFCPPSQCAFEERVGLAASTEPGELFRELFSLSPVHSPMYFLSP